MSAIQHLTMHEMLKQEEMVIIIFRKMFPRFSYVQTFLPAKYRVVIPNTRIFVSAAIDFARSSFDDFNRLSAASRVSIFSTGKTLKTCYILTLIC